jgi:hypothetical protein
MFFRRIGGLPVDGLWTIEFGSNTGIFGSGVVVIRSGRIEGGDASYYYFGPVEELTSGSEFPRAFRARLFVKPFLAGATSVFGTVGQEYILLVDGSMRDENNAVAVGRPEGAPEMNVGIRLQRRPEVA